MFVTHDLACLIWTNASGLFFLYLSTIFLWGLSYIWTICFGLFPLSRRNVSGLFSSYRLYVSMFPPIPTVCFCLFSSISTICFCLFLPSRLKVSGYFSVCRLNVSGFVSSISTKCFWLFPYIDYMFLFCLFSNKKTDNFSQQTQKHASDQKQPETYAKNTETLQPELFLFFRFEYDTKQTPETLQPEVFLWIFPFNQSPEAYPKKQKHVFTCAYGKNPETSLAVVFLLFS
jgi:hypothetical protein